MAHGSAAPPATAGRFFVMMRSAVLLLLLFLFQAQTILAATTLGTEEQRLRQRRDDRSRQERTGQPDVRLQEERLPGAPQELPVETPCFPISEFRLAVPQAILATHPGLDRLLRPGGRLAFLNSLLDSYRGQCLGTGGINLVVRQLSGELLDRGFTTTRIGIPAQDLSGGELHLDLIPGLVRKIIPVGQTTGFSSNALPFAPGDLLNLRELEQGLEQMLLVPGQDASFDLLPGEAPGESDIRITIRRARPVRLRLTLDDSGSADTGRWRAGATLHVDTPLLINDSLDISYQDNAEPGREAGSADDLSLAWAVPFGWWRVQLEAERYRYRQQITGINQNFTSSGETERIGGSLGRTLWRDARQKAELRFRVSRRRSRSFIDDTEIRVQRRDQSEAEVAFLERIYLGRAQFDLRLAHHWGTPWFGARRDLPDRQPGDPSFFYRLQTLDLNLSAPVKVFTLPCNDNFTLHGQYAGRRLYTSEQLAIGSRYTVRGFDGDQMLSGERGVYLRNDFDVPLGHSGQGLYLGLDYGHVAGPSSGRQPGRDLLGTVIGVRGGYKGFSYDLFAGWPLYQPDGFDTDGTTVGVSLGWEI